MFGQMQISWIFQLSKLEAADEAVAKLLEFAEYPHCFTTNMKQRCRSPDFREEKMQRLRLKAPASVVEDYLHLFVNRRPCTLQSNRPHPQSARHYYYRPKDKKSGQGPSLTPDTIRRHLEGEITIGLYAVTRCIGRNNQDACCRS